MTARQIVDAILPVLQGPFESFAVPAVVSEVKAVTDDTERAALKKFVTDLGNAL